MLSSVKFFSSGQPSPQANSGNVASIILPQNKAVRAMNSQ